MNGRTYVKFPIRTDSTLKIRNIDTYCFLWSILASIHAVDNDPQRVTKYEPYRNEIIITNIDFINSMKVVDIPRFERLNPSLSISVFESSKDEDNEYILVPIYISKNNENKRSIDLIFYKNRYMLLKKLHVFIDQRYLCRNCLKSKTNQLLNDS